MENLISLGAEHIKSIISFRRIAWIVLAVSFVSIGTDPTFGLSRTYICFFELGSAQLTDRCKLIISEAAGGWRRIQQGQGITPDETTASSTPVRPVRIDVLGYAPDMANAEGNKRLSLLRALAVADELRHAGVPGELITPFSFGGDHMLVPGEPLDPQNRNVVVVLR